MVTFILGRSGSGKTQQVLENIAEQAQAGKRDMILLVPEQQSHVMERMLCEKASNRISMSAEAATFRRLCRRVAAEAGGLAKTLLDDGARIIYMYRAVAAARQSLKALKGAVSRPEFLDTLVDITDRIKASGITPEKLMELSGDFPPSLAEKLNDIALIYSAYQGEITQSRVDSMGELQKLEEDLRATSFFKGKSVWIDGFTGFTGVEYKILRLIFSQAEQLTVSLCADLEDTSPAFAKANETYMRLKAMAPHDARVLQLTENHRAKKKALAHAEKNALSDFAAEILDCSDGIEFSISENIHRECEFAASRILELVRDEGYRFRDISVSVRDVEEYSDIIEAVFGYYGVPVYLSKKTPVSEKAPVALVINALKCISGNFRYDDMLRYIKTGLCGVNRRASDMLEEYMSVWHLRGSDWSREQGFTRHPLGYGFSEDENSKRMLETLNRVRNKVCAPLLNLKSAIKDNPTGEGCARAIFDYFNDINLAGRLQSRARMLHRRGDLQAAQEYRTLWDVLCSAVNSIGQVLGDAEFEIDEFARLFKLVLSKYSVGTIPTALDRVSVGDLSRPGMLGQVRVQILLGVNDGVIPMTSSGGMLFTESECRILSDSGIELSPDTATALQEEFRLAYTAISAPSEKLILSRLLTRPSGDAGRESFVYTGIKAMFTDAMENYAGENVLCAATAPCFDAVAGGGAQWSGARQWLSQHPEWNKKLELANRGSCVERGPIRDKDNIRAIFGNEIYLSASRADVYGACKYRYFLQYGLKLRKKEPAQLSAPIAGTMIHYILENTLRQIEGTCGVQSASASHVEKIARDWAQKYAEECLGQLSQQSARFRFVFNRLAETAVRVAQDVCAELSISSFKPISFELKVSDNGGELPAVHMTTRDAGLRLEGFIDRVDGMETPDGKLWVRVVDYKTGKKDFRMDEALNGLNIQLLVYLFALEKEGKKLYGKDIIPAGVMYVPARNPIMNTSGTETPEELEIKRVKNLKRKGVLVNDLDMLNQMEHGMEKESKYLPIKFGKDGALSQSSDVISRQDLGKLKEHMDGILKDIAVNLSHGEVRANPYYKNRTETACTNCPYAEACMFDTKAGDKARYLYKNNPEEFFKQREGVTENGKCQMDG